MNETNGEAIVRMMRDSLPKVMLCGGVDLEPLQDLMCHSLGYCPAGDQDDVSDEGHCAMCIARWLDEPFSGAFSLRYEPDGLCGPFTRFEPVGREVVNDED